MKEFYIAPELEAVVFTAKESLMAGGIEAPWFQAIVGGDDSNNSIGGGDVVLPEETVDPLD